MASIQDGTGGGLVEFLKWTVDKGLVKKATAASYSAAVVKALEIEGDDWKELEIRGLDVEDQLRRFETKSGGNYSPQSLATYKGRFAKAVTMYLDYLDSPSSFKAPVQTRRRAAASAPGSDGANGETASDAASPRQADDELIEYAFPLKSGATAYLRLPRRFDTDEIDRLTKFLSALAIDRPKGLPEGSPSP